MSSADNSCSLSTNCFQFALSVFNLGFPRLSGTFVKASVSIITVAMWSEVRASNWLQSAIGRLWQDPGSIHRHWWGLWDHLIR